MKKGQRAKKRERALLAGGAGATAAGLLLGMGAESAAASDAILKSRRASSISSVNTAVESGDRNSDRASIGGKIYGPTIAN